VGWRRGIYRNGEIWQSAEHPYLALQKIKTPADRKGPRAPQATNPEPCPPPTTPHAAC
jgi:hypothetical protein